MVTLPDLQIPGVFCIWFTATYCNILQHTATCCNTIQHTTTIQRSNTLQNIAFLDDNVFCIMSSTTDTRHNVQIKKNVCRYEAFLSGWLCCSVLQCIAVDCTVLRLFLFLVIYVMSWSSDVALCADAMGMYIIFIYIYIYLYIHLFPYLYISVNMYLYVHLYMYIYKDR